MPNPVGPIAVLAAILTQAPAPPTPPPTPPPVTRIVGQIVDPLGRGLAGAEIVVQHDADTAVGGRTTTGEYGDFELLLDGEHPGSYSVTVQRGGFTPAQFTLDISEDDLEPFVDAMLEGAMSVAGEVREVLERMPLAGAAVRLRTPYREFNATSDAQGRFAFERLVGGPVELIVSAEGFGRFIAQLQVAELPGNAGASGLDGAALYTVILSPEKVLTVTVVDDRGAPVDDASIELRTSPTRDYHTARSSAEGLAVLRGLPGDTAAVALRATHRDFVASGDYDIDVAFPEGVYRQTHTIALQPGATLTGTVTRRDDRRPLNGARVTVGTSLEQAAPYTFTRLDGTYSVGALPEGATVVTVHVTGYAPELQAVTLTRRETTTVNVQMQDGRTVSGVVRGADDRPLDGAEVTALSWRGHRTLGLSALTDADGRFALEHAPSDAFEIDIVAPGRSVAFDLPIAAGQDTYTFTLERDTGRGPGTISLCEAKVGDELPNIPLTTLAGTTYDPPALKGKWVVLDFWATWCGPCVAELPTLMRWHATYGRRDDVKLLGISRDFDAAALRRFIERRSLPWEQVHGPQSGSDALTDAFKVRGIPLTVLVDPEGRIAAVGLTAEELIAEFERRFAE